MSEHFKVVAGQQILYRGAVLGAMDDMSRYINDIVIDEAEANSITKPHTYVYLLTLDAFHTIGLCAHAFNRQAYSQVFALLRQITEQVTISKLLIENPGSLNLYGQLQELRQKLYQESLQNFGQQAFQHKKLIKESHELSELMRLYHVSQKDKNRRDFLEYGWLLECGGTSLGIEQAMALAGLKRFILNRQHYNQFMHGNLSSFNYINDLTPTLDHEAYNLAFLCHKLLCAYRELSGYEIMLKTKKGEHKVFNDVLVGFIEAYNSMYPDEISEIK